MFTAAVVSFSFLLGLRILICHVPFYPPPPLPPSLSRCISCFPIVGIQPDDVLILQGECLSQSCVGLERYSIANYLSSPCNPNPLLRWASCVLTHVLCSIHAASASGPKPLEHEITQSAVFLLLGDADLVSLGTPLTPRQLYYINNII